jgi:hypothetical protein
MAEQAVWAETVDKVEMVVYLVQRYFLAGRRSAVEVVHQVVVRLTVEPEEAALVVQRVVELVEMVEMVELVEMVEFLQMALLTSLRTVERAELAQIAEQAVTADREGPLIADSALSLGKDLVRPTVNLVKLKLAQVQVQMVVLVLDILFVNWHRR